MCMRTREGYGIGSHVIPFIEPTTIAARVANKQYRNPTYLRFLIKGQFFAQSYRNLQHAI